MPDTLKWGIFPMFYRIFINKGKFPMSQIMPIFPKKGIKNARLATLERRASPLPPPPPPSLMRPPPSNPKRTEEEPEGKRGASPKPPRHWEVRPWVRGGGVGGGALTGVRALAELKETGEGGREGMKRGGPLPPHMCGACSAMRREVRIPP